MSDKQENENAEVYQTESRVDQPTVPAAAAPKKRGLLGHLKRFWWAILLVLICLIVLVVCLV